MLDLLQHVYSKFLYKSYISLYYGRNQPKKEYIKFFFYFQVSSHGILFYYQKVFPPDSIFQKEKKKKKKKKKKKILLSDLGTYTLSNSLMYDKVEHKNLQFLAIDPKRVSI